MAQKQIVKQLLDSKKIDQVLKEEEQSLLIPTVKNYIKTLAYIKVNLEES